MTRKAPNVSQSVNIAPASDVGCLESVNEGLEPSLQSQGVVPQRLTQVLEDGKQSQAVESACIQSHPEVGAPRVASHEVIQESVGIVLENVKMKKDLD